MTHRFLPAALLALLLLFGVGDADAVPDLVRGPYLQNAGPTRVAVRWRTSSLMDSRVSYGTTAAALSTNVDDVTLALDHEVVLTGLAPNTAYFYSIGTTTLPLAGDASFTFKTPPLAGSVQPVRMWVLGDAGTAGTSQALVRNGYATFNGAQHTDVWLMLGDNAYNTGTDAQYQAAMFDMYPSQLRSTLLWSTIGNHETAQSHNPVGPVPYFDIFTLPTNGEGGGLASGTEKYYSFDYANVHLVCLDSMTSDKSATGAMAQWLRADLGNTTQHWIVAFWHHPPYSKGSHNSDTESDLVLMRENFLPILEEGGVDLVLGGHSHSYERSKLIDGHYGLSTTLAPSMVLDGGSGSAGYHKPVGLSSNQGAVYIVGGTSGQTTAWTGGSAAVVNPTPHPVMFTSLLRLGSVVLDVNGGRLDVKFIVAAGTVEDSFSILKDIPNVPPTVALTSPAGGTVFAEHGSVVLAATAADANDAIKRVDFYAGSTFIGSDTSAPYTATWSDVPLGTHALTAMAVDTLGANTFSAAVNITVIVPPPVPPTPGAFAVTAGNGQIGLTWAASAGADGYTITRGTSASRPFGVIATVGAVTDYTDSAIPLAANYFYQVSATNLGGSSAATAAASARVNTNTMAALAGGSVSGEVAGTVFRTFGVPSINDSGVLAFLANLSTPSGATSAVLAGAPAVVVARRGGTQTGIAGATFASFGDPLLNGAGQVAFLGKVSGAALTQDEGIWSNRSGALALVAREGAEPPGVSGGAWKNFSSVVLTNEVLAFTASLVLGTGGVSSADDVGLWICDHTSTTLALREGQSLTLASGVRQVKSFIALTTGSIGVGHGYRPGVASIVARVSFTDATQSVLALTPAGFTELASGGGAAPGYAAGAQFGTFGVPGSTASGEVFQSTMQIGTGDVTIANNAAIFLRDGAELVRSFVKGESAAAADVAAVFRSFKDPVATADRRVAVFAFFKGGAVTTLDDTGIWWRTGTSAPSLAAREGGVAPGAGVGRFQSFLSLALPEGANGAPLFVARLAGVLPANDLGLWGVDSTGATRLLLREGQALAGKTALSFTTISAVGRSRAQTRSFNAAQQVVSRVIFTDHTTGIVVSALP